MFKRNYIKLDQDANDKIQVLEAITDFAFDLGITSDKNMLLKDLIKREEELSTGFTDFIAIPHTQSDYVTKPSVLVIKLKKAIDFESMDGKKTNFFIAILVPKASGNEHLKILQKLSREMVNSEFTSMLTSTPDAGVIYDLISSTLTPKSKKIIAVCACPMGLAHTFMAAEVIENYAKKNGYNFKIETQGADGIQNYITEDDIISADVIIHAVAVTPQDNERFQGCNINEIGLQDLIKNPDALMDSFMKNENNVKNKSAEKVTKNKSKWAEISKHLMSGISYMIPILVMGGLLGAIALLIPYMLLGLDPEMSIEAGLLSGNFSGFEENILRFCYVVQGFGFTLFGFAIPVFAGFCAYSIGGKAAWPIGFIGGYISINPVAHAVVVDGEVVGSTEVAAGFMGAVLIAFFVGYFVKFLNKNIKMSHNFLAFKTTFLIPLIAAFSTMILMVYIITPIGGALNSMIETLLIAAGEAGEISYGVILAAATAFDLGGPVNKAAGFVALGFATDGLLPITARCIAIVVPSIGLGLATLIDKPLVGFRVYDPQYKQVGQTSIFLAFMGISEGAIAFALERPGFVIPINMLGAVIAATIATMLGSEQWFAESAIWAWPMIDGIFGYIIAIIVGALFIAFSNVYYRKWLIKRGDLVVK